ncbi:hypothetical protein OAJ74_00945 [Alphaproteobacteria bacterium]|nr:hypothetical protein [Alphaproteobacteria bacterium]
MTNDLTNKHDENVIDLTNYIKIIKKNYLAIIYIFIILFLLYFLQALFLSEKKLHIKSETEFKPASTFTITELEYLQNTIPRYFELLPDNYIPQENFDPSNIFQDVMALANNRSAKEIFKNFRFYDRIIESHTKFDKNNANTIVSLSYILLNDDDDIDIEQLKKENFIIVKEIINNANIKVRDEFFQNYRERFQGAKKFETIELKNKLENEKNSKILQIEREIDLLKNSYLIAKNLGIVSPTLTNSADMALYLHGTIALKEMIHLEESKIEIVGKRHDKNLKKLLNTIEKNNAEDLLSTVDKNLIFYSIGSNHIKIISVGKSRLSEIMFVLLLSFFTSFLYILFFRKK